MTEELWYPEADRYPGPAWKQGYSFFRGYVNNNLQLGAVGHSAEGTYAGCLAVLLGSRRVSWTLTLRKYGRPVQHYPLSAITWHCGRYGDDGGGVAGNACLIGIECEGRKGEPLTDNQVYWLIKVLEWCGKVNGWTEISRPSKEQTFPHRSIPLIKDDELWEHNEISATECPSGRIPWPVIIEGLTMPTQEQEWETYHKGLAVELYYFTRVIELTSKVDSLMIELVAVWRPGTSYPILDHAIFKELKGVLIQLQAAVKDLHGRCMIAGRNS